MSKLESDEDKAPKKLDGMIDPIVIKNGEDLSKVKPGSMGNRDRSTMSLPWPFDVSPAMRKFTTEWLHSILETPRQSSGFKQLDHREDNDALRDHHRRPRYYAGSDGEILSEDDEVIWKVHNESLADDLVSELNTPVGEMTLKECFDNPDGPTMTLTIRNSDGPYVVSELGGYEPSMVKTLRAIAQEINDRYRADKQSDEDGDS